MDNLDRLMVPDALARGLRRAAVQYVKHQIYSAVTVAVSEVDIWRVPAACTIQSVHYSAATASTATGATSAHTLTVYKYDGAGGAGASICSATTSVATPLVAHTPASLGTLTGASLSAGNVLSFSAPLAGTTSTLPAGCLTIAYTID